MRGLVLVVGARPERLFLPWNQVQPARFALGAGNGHRDQGLTVVVLVCRIALGVGVPTGTVPERAIGSHLGLELPLLALRAAPVVFARLREDEIELVVGLQVRQKGIERLAALGAGEAPEQRALAVLKHSRHLGLGNVPAADVAADLEPAGA